MALANVAGFEAKWAAESPNGRMSRMETRHVFPFVLFVLWVEFFPHSCETPERLCGLENASPASADVAASRKWVTVKF